MSEQSPSAIGRFIVRRRIGAGGMGVVYEALDPQTDTVLAVKTLAQPDASHLYLLKQEFRSLAEILHPNLVLLYELFSEDDEWFFTMEYVEGISLLTYVWSPSSTQVSIVDTPTEQATVTALLAPDRPSTAALVQQTAAIPVLNYAHLRSTLSQLAEGLSALHDAGKLHRDIKPSNILVTPDERVVLLDFGLTMDLDPIQSNVADYRRAGTAAYMAPEQALGEKLTPAADWYAVGMLLFEALTGRLPFAGLPLGRSKFDSDPPQPQDLQRDAPEDLCKLCVDLLRRDPAARPSAADVLARLAGAEAMRPRHFRAHSLPGSRHVLRGREAEFAKLHEALDDVRDGRRLAVYVTGPSGMGKTSLISEFLRSIATGRNTRVFTGRCYEQEFVPYKALDGVVDSLVRWLAGLPEREAQELLPPDIGALARLFPVLLRISVVRSAAPIPVANRQELRRRGFAALRQLLRTLAEHALVCIFIDDLQWGDQDSAMLLNELLHSPASPRLLFLGAYRSENASDSAFLNAVLIPRPAESRVEERRIVIGPLAAADAEVLARDLLHSSPSLEKNVARVVSEAQGVPYFIEQLAESAREDTYQDRPLINLDDVLWQRVEGLGDRPRALLEAVSVYGQPLAMDTALDAAALSGADRYAITALRKSKLVRSGTSAGKVELDTFHDRVRDVVRQRLDREVKRRWHAQLADALEKAPEPDAEPLAIHHLGAGRAERAAPYFLRAAEKSAAALAFDRAAGHYESALAAIAWPDAERRRIEAQRADALANAGRAEAAARAYEKALPPDGSAEEMLELKRRIGYYYCVAGRADAGRSVFGEVLRPYRISLPRTAAGAMLSLFRSQWSLRRRGLKYTEAANGSQEALRRIDVLWSVGSSIAIFDLIVGYDFMTRCLRRALDAGEPHRLGRAMAFQAALESTRGNDQRAEELLAKCHSIASRIENPHLLGMLEMGRGIHHGCRSEFRVAREHLERAARIFREQCTGVAWELATTNQWWVYMVQYMGDYVEVDRLCGDMLRQAREHGDLFTIANICTNSAPHLRLLDDDPRAALETLESVDPALGGLPHRMLSEINRIDIDVYAGHALDAWERLRKQQLRLALLMRIVPPTSRVAYAAALGRCALAAADLGADPRQCIRAASRFADWLKRDQDAPMAEGFRLAMLAGIAATQGERDRALELASSSAERLRALESVTIASVMRRRVAQLRGGDAGARAMAEEDEFLRSHAMRNPRRVADTWAPGFKNYS